MGEYFCRKVTMVASGHKATTPPALTYLSVVLTDSVCIVLITAALNNLKVLGYDIQNAYLTSKCREKIYIIAGPEFGTDSGKIMIIFRVLYGLKSSGATFHALLAETLHDIGYVPLYANPDVWMQPAIKSDGF